MKRKINKYVSILFVFLLVILGFFLPETKTVEENQANSKQWYLENDGKEEQVDIDENFCTISEFEKGIDINAESMWKILENHNVKREIIIAVIDTGVDVNSDELQECLWENKDEIANDGIDNDDNGYIDDIYGWNFCNNTGNVADEKEEGENNHGTSIAGIIGGTHDNNGISGIAGNTDIKVMSVKILEGIDHRGTIENLKKGIEYAEDMGADICNLSLNTSTYDSELKTIMKNSNMLFVVAAGNDGINIAEQKIYPAAYHLDNEITVGNIGFDGELYPTSNYGIGYVDIAAPGTNIYSVYNNNTYNYDTGTSMSAPMVSAVAGVAAAVSQNKLSSLQIKKYILSNGEYRESLKNRITTGRYLDGEKVISAVLE